MGVPASEVGYTTAMPCPGGKTTKSIRTCGGIGFNNNNNNNNNYNNNSKSDE
jgi:hypothetical protein